MVAFKITWNQTEIQRIGRTAATLMVTDTTRRVLNKTIVDTPVDTGRLRGGNQSRVYQRGKLTIGEVFNDTEYARAVHDGSKAYTIRPKKKKVLRFEINGEVIYASRVKMPARKGRPWMLRALIEVAGREGYTITY